MRLNIRCHICGRKVRKSTHRAKCGLGRFAKARALKLARMWTGK